LDFGTLSKARSGDTAQSCPECAEGRVHPASTGRFLWWNLHSLLRPADQGDAIREANAGPGDCPLPHYSKPNLLQCGANLATWKGLKAEREAEKEAEAKAKEEEEKEKNDKKEGGDTQDKKD
jgi:hypothetical protein